MKDTQTLETATLPNILVENMFFPFNKRPFLCTFCIAITQPDNHLISLNFVQLVPVIQIPFDFIRNKIILVLSDKVACLTYIYIVFGSVDKACHIGIFP